MVVGGLLITACGGGDDVETTTTTEAIAPEPEPEIATTTTAPVEVTTTTTTPELVVEGATVVVANASIVGGSAGRMTDELGRSGFTTATATNSTEKVSDSIVYYSDAEGAQAVAESVAIAMGGLEARPIPDPIPTESGDIAGAQVLVLLGDNQADRTIAQLSGAGSPTVVETNGLTVVVANASGVSGSAGRMSNQLQIAGFTVGEATNGVVQLGDSIVHYTETEGAQADAEAVAEALGGVEIEPMPDEIPVESGELDGDVLVLLGTNQADKVLDTLNS